MKKRSFQKSMLMGNTAVVTLVVVVLFICANLYLIHEDAKRIQQQTESNASSILEQIRITIDGVNEICLQLSANSYIIRIFEGLPNLEGNVFEKSPELDAQTKAFMWSYLIKKDSLHRIILYSNSGDFTYVGSAVDREYMEKNQVLNSLSVQAREYFDSGAQSFYLRSYPRDVLIPAQDKYIISITREIKNLISLPSEVKGYVEAQVAIRALGNALSLLPNQCEGYLVDEKSGKVLFAYQQTEEGIAALRDNRFEKGFFYTEVPVENLGINLVLAQSKSVQNGFISVMFGVSLLLSVLVIFAVAFGQYFTIKNTSKPITELCQLIESVNVSRMNLFDFTLDFQEDSDEVRRLSRAFQQLLEALKRVTEQHIFDATSAAKATLYALQSQINPHFFHNMLAVIASLAEEGDNEKIVKVCGKLSQNLRYVSSFSETEVPLNDEVSNAISYLELMKIRYEEKLEYSIQYIGDDSVPLVPKFILQPLLENSFRNGFKKTFPWQLFLEVYTTSDLWYVKLIDNGVGMDVAALEKIRGKIAQIKKESTRLIIEELKIGGLSIPNICMRLFLLYRENMIFEVDSVQGEYFQIRIGGRLN